MPPRPPKSDVPVTASAKPRPPRKPPAAPAPAPTGLEATACLAGPQPAAFTAVCDRIVAVGGVVAGRYREPLGGHWVALAVLPIDRVEPTPYQRELSPAHTERLALVIPKVGRFLDPIVAVPDGAGFRSPNGMHRLAAMRALGARAITVLVVPEPEIAFRILALNTEKAHNLRDKALEVIRMVRALLADPAQAQRPESDFTLEFEQPGYLTIGVCYERNGRFSGGAYLPVVSRCEAWSDRPLADVIGEHEAHAEQLLELDMAVAIAVMRLKDAGFTSGYLKPVVIARINPLRFAPAKAGPPVRSDFDRTIAKMLEGARAFDPTKIKAADIAAVATSGSDE